MIFEKIPLSALQDSDIYLNDKKKSMDEIKKETGCTHIFNGGFYERETHKPMNHLVVDGKVISSLLGKIGLSMDGKRMVPSYDNQVGFPDHVSGYPALVVNGVAQTNFPKDLIPATQRTVIGFTPDAIIIAIFTTPIKLTEVPDIMIALGCNFALNLDGGGSTQFDFNGKRHFSSRRVHNYICIWAETSSTISLPKNTQTEKNDENDLDIIQNFIAKGRANRPGKQNPMQYVTIHDTGNTNKGANAIAHGNYLKGDSAAQSKVSYHYTVDDTYIVQHLPDDETAYHAGDGSGDGNTKSIGIEICINSDGDLKKATDNAVKLTAYLCNKYDIPIENVVQHYRWNKKDCPKNIRKGNPYSWNDFLGKVENIISPKPIVSHETDVPSEWAKSSWEKAKEKGIMDGSRPRDSLTRQELSVILDRLKLI